MKRQTLESKRSQQGKTGSKKEKQQEREAESKEQWEAGKYETQKWHWTQPEPQELKMRKIPKSNNNIFSNQPFSQGKLAQKSARTNKGEKKKTKQNLPNSGLKHAEQKKENTNQTWMTTRWKWIFIFWHWCYFLDLSYVILLFVILDSSYCCFSCFFFFIFFFCFSFFCFFFYSLLF